MPQFERMSARHLLDVFVADGWTPKYRGRHGERSLLPAAASRAILTKPGHPSHAISLTGIITEKRVEALCKSAAISAEKLAQLRATVAAVPAKIR